ELRIACSVAHMERAGGVTPVVSPFAQVRDGGNLLTRAGLALPAVDQDDFVVRYAAGPAEVVEHLRAMGESNAVQQRQRYLGKDVPLAAGAAYSNMFGSEVDGSVQATYQVMYLAGWSPHEAQQRPAQRGSATVSFQVSSHSIGPCIEGY
ncbi:putative methyltransferase At1g22800, partial [Haematococcus lacustris]